MLVKRFRAQRQKRGDPEHQLQLAFFDWVDIKKKTDPRYNWIFAVPNGGHRHIGVARKLKREGVRKGVPDVLIPVNRGASPGAVIEFKVGKNKPTDEQHAWISHLIGQQWRCAICYSLEDAIRFVEGYLD